MSYSYSVGDDSSAPIGIPIPNARMERGGNERGSEDYSRPIPTGSGYLPMGTSVTTEETLASSQSSHSPFRDNTLLQTNSIASTSHDGVQVIQSPIDHAGESAILREGLNGSMSSIRPKLMDRDNTVIDGDNRSNEQRKVHVKINTDGEDISEPQNQEQEQSREHDHELKAENGQKKQGKEVEDDGDDGQLLRSHSEQIRYIREHYNLKKRNNDITNTTSADDNDEVASADTTTETVEVDLNIAEFPTDKLLEMLTALLNKIIKSNDDIDGSKGEADTDMASLLNGQHTPEKEKYLKSILGFKGKHVPQISLYQYFQRIQKYCPTTNDVFLSLLVYFDRISKRCNAADDDSGKQLFVMDSYNIHRLVIAGVTVCTKFFSDFFYSNNRYARVGGISLQELNHLEIQFLILCDFELLIPVDKLQRYANLLLRFWNNQEEL